MARHLSVFGEDIALTETLEWLRELRFKELEDSRSIEATLLQNVRKFINQDDFLPNNVKMERVTSDGVMFVDARGLEVEVEALSDGYRSVLSTL